jgi:hypothetical protein
MTATFLVALANPSHVFGQQVQGPSIPTPAPPLAGTPADPSMPAPAPAKNETDYLVERFRLPPETPIQFWYSDGTYYHYVLSCCEGTSETWDYGVLASDTPISVESCGDGQRMLDNTSFFFFEKEPDHTHTGAKPWGNMHPLSFRGIDAPADGDGETYPLTLPYSADDGAGNQKVVRFRLDAKEFGQGLENSYFVLYVLIPPPWWKGDDAWIDNMPYQGVIKDARLYMVIEYAPGAFNEPLDDLETEEDESADFFHPLVPDVKLKTAGRSFRSKGRDANGTAVTEGPLLSGELHFKKRQFPGSVGVLDKKVTAYVIRRDANLHWGELGSE